MGDEPHAENGVDLPAPQRVARRPPERLAIIRQDSDVQEDAEGEHQCARQVCPVELAARRRDNAIDVGRFDLVVEAREQPLRIVGIRDAAAPHRHHVLVRPQEAHVAFTRRIVLEPPGELEPIPQRRLRQRLQEVDGQHRDARDVDEILNTRLGVVGISVEPEDDAGRNLQSIVVERLDRFHHRHGDVLALAHRLERVGLGRLDADKYPQERALPHELENFGLLGDVERRLAGELQGIAVLFLPGEEMRQHVLGGFAIADEIVIDEIDDRRMPLLLAHGIELGGDLGRRLQPRLSAVKVGNVAELAEIGTAAGELQGQHQVALQRDEVVGRNREILQRQPILGLEAQLCGRARDALVKARDQLIGRVPDLADVEIVDIRVHFGRRRDRRPAQHHDLAGCMRARGDVVDLRGLDVHAADQHGVGPGEIGVGRLADVFVDEADRPSLRHIGRGHEQALRRHERAHAFHQPVGVVEGAERGGVVRKNAQQPAPILDWDR